MSDWIPFPVQQEALERPEFEVLFGGSRGPGKTDAGIAWLMYDVDNPLLRALVIRKNSEDLKDWVDRATRMFAKAGGVCTGNPATFKFPSGAVVRCGHLKDDNAYTKYQGHEYQRILIEELTQIPRESQYLMLLSSCRSTVPGLPAQVFATTNPGGAGHEWVKQRFVDVGDPKKPYQDLISGRMRIFIPALVDDNPYLMENDPAYVKFLDALPPSLREAWRLGSWDEVDNEHAYFQKIMRRLEATGHISAIPFEPLLPVDTYWDLGKNDTNAIWFVQTFGREVRCIDYLEDTGLGLKQYLQVMVEKGKELGYEYGKFYFPHDMAVSEYTQDQGVTRLDTFKKFAEEIFGRKFKEHHDYIMVPRVLQLSDAIEAVRQVLPFCFFDKILCKEGVKALKGYQKEFDEKKNTYRDYPAHDWASHGTSAFMQMARTTQVLQQLKEKKKAVVKPRIDNMLTGEKFGSQDVANIPRKIRRID